VITIEKVLFLRNVALFASMPSRELGRIAGIADEVVYPAGSVVIKEGDYGDSMFLIVEGQVRIYRGEVELTTLGPRAYFGEMSILDGEPRSASAAAASDCLLLRINQADFHEILSANFEATLSIVRMLISHIRSFEAVKYSPTAQAGKETPA